MTEFRPFYVGSSSLKRNRSRGDAILIKGDEPLRKNEGGQLYRMNMLITSADFAARSSASRCLRKTWRAIYVTCFRDAQHIDILQ